MDRFGIGRIVEQGSRLPCDFNLRVTHWNQPVAESVDQVVDQAAAVVATGMTLAIGTFDRLLEHCRSRALPFGAKLRGRERLGAQ